MERMLILFFFFFPIWRFFSFGVALLLVSNPRRNQKTLEGFSQSFSALQMIGEYSFLSILLLSPQDPLALFWV